MRRMAMAAALMLVLASVAVAQETASEAFRPSELPSTAAERQILAELDRMARSHQTYLSVPVADGMALRLLTEAVDAQRVVEIGTSTGYSGLWFCLALEDTGGHLTTFEINHGRALEAEQHFRDAGVESKVTV
jgi:caffeoyl-CoA O-methyltransferase